jgi:hypothetical protein
MKIISIDPGREGAMALLHKRPSGIKLLEAVPLPDLYMHNGRKELLSILSRWIKSGVESIIMEEQSSRGGNSAQASFSHGRGYGMLEMAISGWGVFLRSL